MKGYFEGLYPFEFSVYLADHYTRAHAWNAEHRVLFLCDNDDEKAFWKFFDLLDEFLATQ
jgi:hypothetical protein